MRMAKTTWIGIDDTDSKKSGCTTYVAAVLIRRIQELGYSLAGYPRLIRLNPSCPYKTRGNAAVAIAVEADRSEALEEVLTRTVEEYADLDAEGTDPGAAILVGDPPDELRAYYWRVVRDISTIVEAEKVAEKVGAKLFKWKAGRGVIGALASIGADLSIGRTYELIAHRKREYWGTVRLVDPASVWEMDRATYPMTFDNVDRDSGEIRITPHTPCPVLLGIRGVTPEIVERAYKMLRIYEPVEFYTVFETNQATDAHLQKMKIRDARDGLSAIIECRVASKPRYTPGGHVFFEIEDETGRMTCAVYEPAKKLRHVVVGLEPGDEITVYGGVKMKQQGLTINLEKLHVRSLARVFVRRAPRCSICGRKMERIGRRGYECRVCKIFSESPEIVEVKRSISTGVYEVPPSARRHLSMPLALAGHHQHR